MRFKVWDKVENKWFEEINQAQDGKIVQMVLFPKGFLVLRQNDKMIHCESTWSGRFHPVMGSMMPDKTKTEIFLGDVLRIRGTKELGRVVFAKGMFCVQLIGTNEMHPLVDYAPISKIIGNQYEQPFYLNININGESK